MSLGKKTINLIKKVLQSKNKRKFYSEEELIYMETQLKRLIAERKRRKARRKKQKGFAPVTSGGNTENYDEYFPDTVPTEYLSENFDD